MSNKIRLLLADNSSGYCRNLRSYLELDNYHVEVADTVDEALAKLDQALVDLILADLRLTKDDDPYDFSGLEVAKKANEKRIPCIIITAFPTTETAILALRARGAEPLADEYVPKANGPQAVLDAIEHVLRRSEEPKNTSNDLVLNGERRLASYKGEPLELSRQQYALLSYLYERAGIVCSPEELLKAVYDEDIPPQQASSDKRLERMIERLRQKIEDEPRQPRHLIKEPRRGYRLILNP